MYVLSVEWRFSGFLACRSENHIQGLFKLQKFYLILIIYGILSLDASIFIFVYIEHHSQYSNLTNILYLSGVL